MKLYPYLHFNGNCIEAIKFYETAFKTKARTIKYKDATRFDANYVIEKGTEDLVMHSSIDLSDGNILQVCDVTANKFKNNNNTSLMLCFKTNEEVISTFNILKEDGVVDDSPNQTFWTPYFCSVTDKFGVYWIIMQEDEN